ncbi:MAG: PSD1 and planctomycete cytochrome C domain-containing protein [Gemmataceae bacterium]
MFSSRKSGTGAICLGLRVARLLVLLGAMVPCTRAASPADDFFEQKIRPLLNDQCQKCHGEKKQQGGLRLDSLESVLKGGDSGPAVVPGKPDDSLMIRAIRHDGDLKMPSSKKLPASQIGLLERWVAEGAPWPEGRTEKFAKADPKKHWSFQPVTQPAIPSVRDKAWPRNPVDAFILARLEAAGLEPLPPAEPAMLLRRVTYDLTGLPATPEEQTAFERDHSPQAYARVVDRLLASRPYGEHWGRHWLDLVRYADTAGENSDHPLPHAWRYRNWVMDALNADMPYDRFVREQLAGDLLAKGSSGREYSDHIVATGYWAIARRFGHDIDKDHHLTLEDAIGTLGQGVLGLTLGCARCHDHKYDPLTMRDYYGLYGILSSTSFSFPGCEPKQQPRDLVALLSPADRERMVQPLDAEIAKVESRLKELAAKLDSQGKASAIQGSNLSKALASGVVPEGATALLPESDLRTVPVKKGEALVLTIGNNGGYGADTTRLELSVEEVLPDGKTGRVWSLADLLANFHAGNPHADRHGNANTWLLLADKGTARLLPEKAGNINNRPELLAWRLTDNPSVLVNNSDQPVNVWTTLAPRGIFVHPGPDSAVGIGWLSPLEGTVRLRGLVQDAHRAALDGVTWKLQQMVTPRWGIDVLSQADTNREMAALDTRLKELKAEKAKVPVAYAVTEGKPADARLHLRGDPEKPGDLVPRKNLDILGGQKVLGTQASGRLELANWLTSANNPLTARVMANRLWQIHMGKGIVTTPSDFGTRGQPPSHPELLDHLASTLIQSGWSLKSMHRLLVLSATYQQQAVASDSSGLFRGHLRRRLTAEEIRDSFLAATGELDPTPGEGHPFPPEGSWSFTQHGPFAADYPTNKRTVYQMQKRNRRDRFLALFDGADPNASTASREATTVPTQALYFLNDPFIRARIAGLEKRLALLPTDQARLDAGCRLLFCRPASEADRQDLAEFLAGYPNRSPGEAWRGWLGVMLAANEVLYVD